MENPSCLGHMRFSLVLFSPFSSKHWQRPRTKPKPADPVQVGAKVEAGRVWPSLEEVQGPPNLNGLHTGVICSTGFNFFDFHAIQSTWLWPCPCWLLPGSASLLEPPAHPVTSTGTRWTDLEHFLPTITNMLLCSSYSHPTSYSLKRPFPSLNLVKIVFPLLEWAAFFYPRVFSPALSRRNSSKLSNGGRAEKMLSCYLLSWKIQTELRNASCLPNSCPLWPTGF